MMAPMAGRRPFTTVDVVPSWEQRLAPPESLGPLERKAFVHLVSACPLAQFTAADLPLLCRWAELEVMAQRAAVELQQAMIMTDGKVSPWFSIHATATKAQTALALRLRLGPQSRLQKAPKTQAAPLSGYERLALLDVGDDDEAAN